MKKILMIIAMLHILESRYINIKNNRTVAKSAAVLL